VRRTTFTGDDVVRDMPDITGITIDPGILLDCVNEWRMRNFEGAPPDPHEVVLRNTAQQEVVIMANYAEFIRDEPKRLAASVGVLSLGDM